MGVIYCVIIEVGLGRIINRFVLSWGVERSIIVGFFFGFDLRILVFYVFVCDLYNGRVSIILSFVGDINLEWLVFCIVRLNVFVYLKSV